MADQRRIEDHHGQRRLRVDAVGIDLAREHARRGGVEPVAHRLFAEIGAQQRRAPGLRHQIARFDLVAGGDEARLGAGGLGGAGFFVENDLGHGRGLRARSRSGHDAIARPHFCDATSLMKTNTCRKAGAGRAALLPPVSAG